MKVTMDEVRAALSPEEPDYGRAAQLGPDALPYLEAIMRASDPLMAAKAVYLAGLIPTQRSISILAEAAQHPQPTVRVAAAATMSNLTPPDASQLLLRMMSDSDLGVVKVALQSVPQGASPALRDQLHRMAVGSGDSPLGAILQQALARAEAAISPSVDLD